MSDVRNILIPCNGCGHKTSTTVAQWSVGFACENCGEMVRRPTPGSKQAEAPQQPSATEPPPSAVSANEVPRPSVRHLKQAPTVATGIAIPGHSPTPAAPPPAAVPAPARVAPEPAPILQAASPQQTGTRSMQLQHAERRADDLATDLQILQQTNFAQKRSLEMLMDENRELKVKLQRLAIESQSAELDKTAELHRLRAENQVIREKFDGLVKERIQLRSNLSMLEARCHRMEQEDANRSSAPTPQQAAETLALRKKVAELAATGKIIREKFDQVQARYKETRVENVQLSKRVGELEQGAAGGNEAAMRTLQLRLDREHKKTEELENQNRQLLDQSLKLEVEAGMFGEKLAAADARIAMLEAAASSTGQREASLTQAEQAAREIAEGADHRANEAIAARAKLLEEVEQQRKQLEVLQMELSRSRDQEQLLDSRLREIHAREDVLTTELRGAESDLAKLRDRLAATQSGTTADALIEPIEVERLKLRLDELEKERASIVVAEKTTDDQISSIRVENRVLREKLDELLSELAMRQVGPTSDNHTRLEIENRLLREKLDELLGPSPAVTEKAAPAVAVPAVVAAKSDTDTGKEPVSSPATDAAADFGSEAEPASVTNADSTAKAEENEPRSSNSGGSQARSGGPANLEQKRRQALAQKLKQAKEEAARKQNPS